MTTLALVALLAVAVAGFVYSIKRNGRQIMADLDRYEAERTCPPVDDRTRFLKMMEDEFGHE